jgi:hypothetical protein
MRSLRLLARCATTARLAGLHDVPFSTVPKITVDILAENRQIVAPHNYRIMAAKKIKAQKGPRGPVLKTIKLRELIKILHDDQDAEIQVSRRSVIAYLERKTRQDIKF